MCDWRFCAPQKSFMDLGEAAKRVHLIDVDDPQNAELVKFQGIDSFPTIVVVQGNNVLGKSSGYKVRASALPRTATPPCTTSLRASAAKVSVKHGCSVLTNSRLGLGLRHGPRHGVRHHRGRAV